MEYIIIGSIAIAMFIFLFLIIKVEVLRNRANALFLQAEKYIDDNKLEYVSKKLYENVPSIVKIIIKERFFKEMVQIIYDNTRSIAKDLLDDGKLNKSI